MKVSFSRRAKAITFHKFNNVTSIVQEFFLHTEDFSFILMKVAAFFSIYTQRISILPSISRREENESTYTWVFHYRKIFNIISTLLRLHKSMKLRFFFFPALHFAVLSSSSEQHKNISWKKNTLADEKFEFLRRYLRKVVSTI